MSSTTNELWISVFCMLTPALVTPTQSVVRSPAISLNISLANFQMLQSLRVMWQAGCHSSPKTWRLLHAARESHR
ncbi:MAG: hypothetical protein GFH27_549303n91 [Chloroflexi bacterium AL-W]|nr:hypothetical protein [Chloroflexi bacterium AL-N1]NOK67976.1 hypothetical protein [Chloroflexi bacterium AL-N10]NOK73316.1 hypothetical protein [Chloroflexi bacterium AL-N5]NOK83230.1 hypothetical protein [Chloroflexi bacterium AL-W]NOK87647.1 hypothetical protein [Chloroflexi bacterium AL-N15]